MKDWKLRSISLATVFMLLVTSEGLLQAQTVQRNRIPQQVIVNGQQVNGAYVPASSGGMQTFTCSSPQQYTTPDGSSQGWACFDQATGTWLLNAIPPASTAAQAQAPAAAQLPPPAPLPAPAGTAPPVYQQPGVVYQQAPAVVYAAPYPAYPAYPAYPVVVAPAYPSNVILGAAIIGAAGSIASAAIWGSHFYGPYYPRNVVVFRGRR